ncbi:TadE/TadG family type IV pilus assembly protein [Granulicella aggregans]|uniref:TadE/TadG family type IV pilus assembly protein n=1 Tax=Granulicella aggregans TaxID=474949 RepID=UPI0021E0BE87|nr:TadE family protein [Granulicella aggregans]
MMRKKWLLWKTVGLGPELGAPKRSFKDRFARVAHENQGSMVIETALVLPVFFMLLIGIFELSMLLVSICSATYAANVGARYASLNSSTSLSPASQVQIQNVVKANLYLPGTTQPPTILVLYGDGSSTGNYVGDLVGIGVIVFSYSYTIPFYGTRTGLLDVQAYRFISR